MNQVTLVGRLVREVALQNIGENKVVLNNTIAVQRLFKTDPSQTDFIPIVVWGKVAEIINSYCEKGDLIGVNGKMQSRSFVNRNDETIFIVEMRVDEVQFLKNKRSEERE